MKNTFTGTCAEKPSDLSIKAQLGWEYYFEKQECACVHLSDDTWIVCDSDYDLNRATIFVNNDIFTCWLEDVVNEKLEDDAVKFLSQFVVVPELVNEKIAKEMQEIIKY